MADRERLSPEEIEALFSPEDEEGDDDPGLTEVEGLPPDLFTLVEELGARTLLAAFEDLDDFLEVSVDIQTAAVSSSRFPALQAAARGGAHAAFTLVGEPEGKLWLVLEEPSLRVFLARVLAAPGERLEDPLGPLHQAALEGPLEEYRSCLERHLEDEGLEVALEGPEPTLGSPEAPAAAVPLIRLDCPVELDGGEVTLSFFLEEALALRLADHVRRRREAEAAEEAEAVARSRHEAPGPDGGELVALLGRAPGGGVRALHPGDVVRLDRLAGDWVELRLGGRTVAEGQVVVEDDHYAIRVERLLDEGDPAGEAP